MAVTMAGLNKLPVDRPDWAIQLWECGEISQCCYSWWCPQCALAQARTNMDGSDCFFNFFFMGACPGRWIIRTAYGIQGTAEEDCLLVCCCSCCAVNQMLQTTNALGDPFGPAPGMHLERPDIYLSHSGPLNCQCDDLFNCCYSCFCFNCAIGSALEESVGLPCWMGCCCTNFCAARNIQRIHYRIGGADCCDDGCIPLTAYCSLCFFPFSIVGFIYLVNFAMDMLKEGRLRDRPMKNPRYIAGYKARDVEMIGFDPSAGGVVQMEPTNMYSPGPPQGYTPGPYSPAPSANYEYAAPQYSAPPSARYNAPPVGYSAQGPSVDYSAPPPPSGQYSVNAPSSQYVPPPPPASTYSAPPPPSPSTYSAPPPPPSSSYTPSSVPPPPPSNRY